jgi:hypothetical protein
VRRLPIAFRVSGTTLAAAVIGVALLGAAVLAHAAIIAQWNFNGPLTGTLTPSAGEGTLRSVGVSTSGFGSATVGSGSSDPVTGNPPNYAWQVSGFAPQGSADRSAGIQARVDTSGFAGVVVSFDFRPHAVSARHQQFQYSLDGSSFIDFGAPLAVSTGDTWTLQRSIDLSAIAGAADNALFAFRLVAAFAPGTAAYQSSTAGASYAPQGTWRFDMLTVSGAAIVTSPPGARVAAVPVPSTAPLLLAGVLLLFTAARRRLGAGYTL